MNFRVALPILVSALLPALGVQAQISWSTPEIAVTGSNIRASLVMTSGGQANVAYFKPDSGDLFVSFIQRTGGIWTDDSPVGVSRGAANPLGLSLKMDGTSNPQIGYMHFGGFEADYIAKSGGVWGASEIIANTPGAIGEYIHVAVASNNTPRAAFLNANNLFYSTKASGSWVTETVTNKGIPAFLRLDGSDNPYIGYVDNTDVSLKIATFNVDHWDYDTAIAAYNGTATSVAMSLNNGNITITYQEGGVGINMVKKTGGVWGAPVLIVADVDAAFSATSLVVDSKGHNYVAYATTTNMIKVADDTTGSWSIQTISTTGGLNTAMDEVLSLNGNNMGIVFNSTGGDTMYAYSYVPEASTWAWTGGILLLALAARKMRRSAPRLL